jgi:ATP-dependent RNA helicase RhlE
MPFSKLPLHPDLMRGIKELGFLRPTPIQEQAIPPALAGKDVMASAMTGSGKTAAFLLPILHRLLAKPRRETRALVVTPTRELAAQIHAHLEELAVHTPLTGAAVFGGVGMGPQEHAFRIGVDVMIATPGRLLDHLRHPYARLAGLEVLVLDEADRMLDMGFLPDIRRILKQIPTKRQTLFFSATMPRDIVTLAREMLHEPVAINLERKSAPAVGITQAVYPVPQALKAPLLVELLTRDIVANAVVFTRTKHRANRLAEFFGRHGISAARIHANRSQGQRTAALAGFKAGEHRVLVATDIVSRGIDIENLGHVINFDVPSTPDAYIHRVGRTARAEATGHAFTLVSPDEESDLRDIERALGKTLPRVTLSDFDYSQKPVEGRDARPSQPSVAGHSRGGGKAGAGRGGPRRSGGGARPGGSSSTSGSARFDGGQPRSPRPARHRSSQSRLQTILDKHAPAKPGGEGGATTHPRRRRP